MDPYNPPKHLRKPIEQFTSDERKEWLQWYDDAQPQRDKDTQAFISAAAFSLFGSLLIIPAMWLVYEVVEILEHYFVK